MQQKTSNKTSKNKIACTVCGTGIFFEPGKCQECQAYVHSSCMRDHEYTCIVSMIHLLYNEFLLFEEGRKNRSVGVNTRFCIPNKYLNADIWFKWKVQQQGNIKELIQHNLDNLTLLSLNVCPIVGENCLTFVSGNHQESIYKKVTLYSFQCFHHCHTPSSMSQEKAISIGKKEVRLCVHFLIIIITFCLVQ